jgi:ABC-type Fe3+-hydroxamate transport system, periplasmic component
MKKLILMTILTAVLLLTSCAADEANDIAETTTTGVADVAEETVTTLELDYSMELSYAKNFSIDYYKGGYKMITISDGKQFLTIPEGMDVPVDVDPAVTVLQMPINNVLISSTPTISLIAAIGAVDRVSMTTTDVDSWYIESVISAMTDGKLTYIGDYKAPDYELITAGAPQLSVFSTMLSSVPEVEEKLNELQVPILLDQATFEDHPLARVEWVKLYGALFNAEELAEKAFNEQAEYVTAISTESTGKSVSMFYITSKGALYARQGGDYMAKMLELAGGDYVFADLNPEETGTNQMEFETFYADAKDADYIIYIWNLGGRPETLADFIEKNELFSEFKAVQDGNVWCTTPDYFQISNTLGYMIKDMNAMLTLTDDSVDEFTYLFRLK